MVRSTIAPIDSHNPRESAEIRDAASDGGSEDLVVMAHSNILETRVGGCNLNRNLIDGY
jgi:hypothetical protein